MKKHNNDLDPLGMLIGTILVIIMVAIIGILEIADASIIDDITITKEDAINILIDYGVSEKANEFDNNFVTYEEIEEASEESDAELDEFEDELNDIFGIERPEEGYSEYLYARKHILSMFKQIDRKYGKGASAWYACQAYAHIPEGESLGIEYIFELSIVRDIFDEMYGNSHTELERIRSKAILRYKKLS